MRATNPSDLLEYLSTPAAQTALLDVIAAIARMRAELGRELSATQYRALQRALERHTRDVVIGLRAAH